MIKWIKNIFKKKVECRIYNSRLDSFSSKYLYELYEEGWRAVTSSVTPHYEIFIIFERSK